MPRRLTVILGTILSSLERIAAAAVGGVSYLVAFWATLPPYSVYTYISISAKNVNCLLQVLSRPDIPIWKSIMLSVFTAIMLALQIFIIPYILFCHGVVGTFIAPFLGIITGLRYKFEGVYNLVTNVFGASYFASLTVLGTNLVQYIFGFMKRVLKIENLQGRPVNNSYRDINQYLDDTPNFQSRGYLSALALSEEAIARVKNIPLLSQDEINKINLIDDFILQGDLKKYLYLKVKLESDICPILLERPQNENIVLLVKHTLIDGIWQVVPGTSHIFDQSALAQGISYRPSHPLTREPLMRVGQNRYFCHYCYDENTNSIISEELASLAEKVRTRLNAHINKSHEYFDKPYNSDNEFEAPSTGCTIF